MDENKKGFGGLEGLMPVIGVIDDPVFDVVDGAPVEGDDEQREIPADEKPESGKNKKWLIMIAAGVVLWLLLKKRK